MARNCSWYIGPYGLRGGDDLGMAAVQAGQPGDGLIGVLASIAGGLCLVGDGPRSEREQPLRRPRRYSFTFDAGQGSRDRILGVTGGESDLCAHRVEQQSPEAGLLREQLVGPGKVRLRFRRPTRHPASNAACSRVSVAPIGPGVDPRA